MLALIGSGPEPRRDVQKQATHALEGVTMLHALRRAWSKIRRRETERTDAYAVELSGDERSSVEPISDDELRIRAALIRIGGVL